MLDDRKTKRAAEGKYSLVRNVYSEKAFVCYNNERPLETLKYYYVVCYFDKLFCENVSFCQVDESTIEYLNRECCESILKLKDELVLSHKENTTEHTTEIINRTIDVIAEIIAENNLSRSQVESMQAEVRNELLDICEPIKRYILPLISTEFIDIEKAKVM